MPVGSDPTPGVPVLQLNFSASESDFWGHLKRTPAEEIQELVATSKPGPRGIAPESVIVFPKLLAPGAPFLFCAKIGGTLYSYTQQGTYT